MSLPRGIQQRALLLEDRVAFDAGLAERIRDVLVRTPHITEGRMFGGVIGDVLMTRVGSENYTAALGNKHLREIDFTGKPMKGYVYVDRRVLRGMRVRGVCDAVSGVCEDVAAQARE